MLNVGEWLDWIFDDDYYAYERRRKKESLIKNIKKMIQNIDEIGVVNIRNELCQLGLTKLRMQNMLRFFHTEQWVLFAQSLAETPVIKLDLSMNDISNEDVITFAQNLQNTSVREIDFSITYIGEESTYQLFEHLKRASVTTVKLDGCRINETHAINILNQIKNTSITRLGLAFNPCRMDRLSKHFVQSTLNSLDLSENDICATDLPDFFSNIKKSKTRELSLIDIRIHNDITYLDPTITANLIAKNLTGACLKKLKLSAKLFKNNGAAEFFKNLNPEYIDTLVLVANEQQPPELADSIAEHIKGSRVRNVVIQRTPSTPKLDKALKSQRDQLKSQRDQIFISPFLLLSIWKDIIDGNETLKKEIKQYILEQAQKQTQPCNASGHDLFCAMYHLVHVPNEIALKIFSYLPQMSGKKSYLQHEKYIAVRDRLRPSGMAITHNFRKWKRKASNDSTNPSDYKRIKLRTIM